MMYVWYFGEDDTVDATQIFPNYVDALTDATLWKSRNHVDEDIVIRAIKDMRLTDDAETYNIEDLPYITKEIEDMDYKIIDCETKGNCIRFYLGDVEENDYTGDDWDDAPWQDNCGPVYEEYVAGWFDVCLPFNYNVFEPKTKDYYSRNDVKDAVLPCIVVINDADDVYWDFNRAVMAKDAVRIYFNDSYDDVSDIFQEYIIKTSF